MATLVLFTVRVSPHAAWHGERSETTRLNGIIGEAEPRFLASSERHISWGAALNQ
jgi:hypothetical protein